MGLLPLFVVIAAVALYFLLSRYSRGLNRFPGPLVASFTDLWKVWNAYHASTERNDMYVDIHKKYGDVVRIGPNNIVFADPRAISEIYGTKGSQVKGAIYDTFSMPVKGHRNPSLLSSPTQQWHDQQRKLIHTYFSTTAILKYEPWVDDTIDLLIRRLDEASVRAGHDGSPGNVDLYRWLAFFSADVVSNLTYGQRTGFLETGTDVENIQRNVQAVFRFWLLFAQMPILDRLTFKNPILMWFNRRGLFEPKKPLLSIVQRHFFERKKIWEQKSGSEGDRVTLVDRFLQAQRDHQEKVSIPPQGHAFTMVVAGSETTSVTLASIFYFLLKNPTCYKKLEEEIDAVNFDQNKQRQGPPIFSWAVAQSMPYLDACIREAMRMHSVERIPHDRVVPKGGLTICGHFIPEGTEVGVFGPVLHRREEIFGADVESYRPERWLEDSSRTERMRHSMFTFSYGKYTCLGQHISRLEVYKLVPTLIRAFRMHLLDPDWTWELMPGAFTMPKSLPVILTPRRGDET